MPIACNRTDIEIDSLPTRSTFNCEDRGYEIDTVVRVEPAIGINGDRYHLFGWRSRSFVQQRCRTKAAALLKQMTLDEKLGQLNESSGIGMPGVGTEKPDDLIANGGVGSILWQMDVKEINRLQHIAMGKFRLHLARELQLLSPQE
jgi:hypothetical protein